MLQNLFSVVVEKPRTTNTQKFRDNYIEKFSENYHKISCCILCVGDLLQLSK